MFPRNMNGWVIRSDSTILIGQLVHEVDHGGVDVPHGIHNLGIVHDRAMYLDGMREPVHFRVLVVQYELWHIWLDGQPPTRPSQPHRPPGPHLIGWPHPLARLYLCN
jgi:hypothetical protein